MFWNKRKINSEEYEFLHKKLTELLSRVEELTAKIAIVQSDNANLRGQFNRKLSGIKKEEKEEEIIEDEKDINNPVILKWNGYPFKS